MPTYISLLRFTEQGVKTIKDAPSRVDTGRETLRAMGSQLKDLYLVMGRYDLVVISEAKDDETAATFSLATGMQGNVTTETLRAFTETEFRQMMGGLP